MRAVMTRLVVGVAVLGVILFLLFFQPLAVADVTYSDAGEDQASITFRLENRFLGGVHVDKVLYPIDTTSGVAFDSRPIVTDLNGAPEPLIGYGVNGLDSVQVTVPVTVTGPVSVQELRLEYSLLGLPKHVTVPVNRTSA
ncbi:MAG: hypothetical protein ACYC1C_16675 [Chloroflexota bacterium]